jgi:hypothetical protein
MNISGKFTMNRSELLICLIISLALIIGGVVWGARRFVFSQRSLHAQGTVVEQREKKGVKFSTFYYPVVEFRTESGEKVKFLGGAGNSGGPQIPTGSTVDVMCDLADPSQAQIKSFVQYWLGPAGMTAMGLMIMTMGIFFFLKAGGNNAGFR